MNRKIFFDTEFMEDGVLISPISIGMVRDDGREYYAEFEEADFRFANDWVKENVVPHLTGEKKSTEQIGREIKEFAGMYPEFWAWYGSYDWVMLCQIYGTMMDLPIGWPMYVMDFKNLLKIDGDKFSVDKSRTEFGEVHNALADAKWLKREYDRFMFYYKKESFNQNC